MADGCSSSVCAIERRFIKKELLSWTKKVPILVGELKPLSSFVPLFRCRPNDRRKPPYCSRQIINIGAAVENGRATPADGAQLV